VLIYYYDVRHYAECDYAECRYAGCRGFTVAKRLTTIPEIKGSSSAVFLAPKRANKKYLKNVTCFAIEVSYSG
jgi:hypothetical protein